MKFVFANYLRDVSIQKELHPEWRMGQTYFNVLHEQLPNLADQIRGSSFDPFFMDSKIGGFLNYVYEATDTESN